MTFSFWVLFFAIFLIVIILIIGYIIIFERNPPPNTQYTQPQVWSDPVLSTDNSKNTCQIYTFPTVRADIGGTETIIPGNPSYNTEILNSLTGIPPTAASGDCLDIDQIMARQITHTCAGGTGGPTGTAESGISKCYTIAGDLVSVGTSETYYSASSANTLSGSAGQPLNACPGTNLCPGQLSLISIGFEGASGTNRCLKRAATTGGGVEANICDPTDPNQLFRVTRTIGGQAPSQNTQNGPFAQFLNRELNQCLVKDASDNLIFANCSSSGIDWLLLPPLSYCINTAVAPACSINQIIPIPCQGLIVSKQQIVYVGDLNLALAPTNPNCLLFWLREQNAKSLYLDGNNIILKPVDVGTGNDKNYTGQYININLYNFINRQQACTELNQLNCMGF